MTDTSKRNRQAAGQPIGGQFATEARGTDTGVSLGGQDPSQPWDVENWSAPQYGHRSPWGTIDSADEVGKGIVEVGTASHGGVKLSPARNAEVPPSLRNSNGWYEEDTEAYIPMAIYPEEFAAARAKRGGGGGDGWGQPDFVRDQSEVRIREWMPDQWEKWRGQKVLPGQSHVRDAATFRAEHANDHIAISAITSDDHPGMVEVVASAGGARGNDPAANDERHYLVPAEEYKQRGKFGFVIDPDRHKEFKERPKPFVRPEGYREVNVDSMTSRQQAKVYDELNKRWRDDDGTVKTMQQMIDDGEITGKDVTVRNGRREYSLSQQTGPSTRSAMPCSKEMFEAFGAPDPRTPVDHARDEFRIAEHVLHKAEMDSAHSRGGNWGSRLGREPEKLTKARERVAKAKARLREVSGDDD